MGGYEGMRTLVLARRRGRVPAFHLGAVGSRQGGPRLAGRWKLRASVVPIFVLGCLLLPITSAGAQLDARERPRVTGPLAFVNKVCDRRSERAGGRVIATSRSCLRFYAFDPGKENNSRRDFGVVWLQSNVNARTGWCATQVRSVIDFPRRVRTLGTTPGSHRSSNARRIRARLRVSNATDKPGTIQNGFEMYPRRLLTGLVDQKTSFRATWRGSTRRALGFAQGVELSWRANAGAPRVGSVLNFALARSRSC